ncbi:DUF6932 family protein [Streptomyces bacillaris]|uniref:DUF6932 family protein n=1 Tax=Streptomyces bacillaris TaxID=68179 RepID=UPI00370320D6
MGTTPEFVADTDCLPPGRYAMGSADAEYSFVTREIFADSTTRAELWAEWDQHLTLLQTVTSNKISRAWISGSFVLSSWCEALDVIGSSWPELIRSVRAAEAGDPDGRRWPRGKAHDGATVLHWVLA